MIISIKSSASGGSSRGLAHYLAHSKLDQKKEGTEKREFFNESAEDLDVRAANRYLSKTGKKPAPEELLHIVIAPSKEEIENAGEDLRTQKDALQEIVQATLNELKEEVKADKLIWVAVVHFNTDHPHAHVAIQKEFLDGNGKAKDLRINRQMLYYNETNDSGEKTLRKGVLILAAENKLMEIAAERQKTMERNPDLEAEKEAGAINLQANNSQPNSNQPKDLENFSERRILAQHMLVAAEISTRERNIENLIEHGDKKRFRIKDAGSGQVRHLSLFDIERKIELASREKASRLYPNHPQKQVEVISQIAVTEREQYLPVLNQLKTIRHHVLGFENRHLNQASEKHMTLSNQKALIEKKYERLQEDTPLPLFMPDEMQELEHDAIKEQNSEKILLLENIRAATAAEFNQPVRRKQDIRELLAAKIVADLKLEAAERNLQEFGRTKDFIKVKIGDSFLSHHLLSEQEHRQPTRKNLWTQLKSKTVTIFSSSEKENRFDEKPDYPALHQAVEESLETIQNNRHDEVKKRTQFAQTLDQIFQAENPAAETKLTPAFSAVELAEIEDLATAAERNEIYEQTLLWQEDWLREKLSDGKTSTSEKNQTRDSDKTAPDDSHKTAEKIIGKYLVGRAEARLFLAQIALKQEEEKANRYDRNKMIIKHRVKDAKTGAELEVSLNEVTERKNAYLLDWIVQKALEPKAARRLRRDVQKSAILKENEVKRDLESAKLHLTQLEKQKTSFVEKYPSAINSAPVFTPKEIAALNVLQQKSVNQDEARRLERFINNAEKNNQVCRVQGLLQNTAKELQTIIPNLLNEDRSKDTSLNQSNPERQQKSFDQEMNHEITTPEKTNRTPVANLTTGTGETGNEVVKDRGRTR